MEVEVNKQMWKKRLLIISILGNILSLFLIGIYFLVNSWFFHAELGSIVGIKPDYLIQLNNEGVLYDVNVNIRMYNFDDVQCTVIPSVAYGFVTGMNLQLC